MSTVTQISSNGSQQITNYSVEKLLHGNNYFVKGYVDGAKTLTAGMVMGRIASTRKLVQLVKAATDGSQFPVGVVIQDRVIGAGESVEITVVNKGSVNESMLTFLSATDLNTLVGPTNNQKTIRDWMNDLGIVLDSMTELTATDNQ